MLQPSGVQVADLSRESHPRDSLRFSLPEARHGGAVRVILRETRARISLFALLEDMSNRPSSFTAVENSFERWCDNWCFDQPLKAFFRDFSQIFTVYFTPASNAIRNFSRNCIVLHLDSIDYRRIFASFLKLYIFTIYFMLNRPIN